MCNYFSFYLISYLFLSFFHIFILYRAYCIYNNSLFNSCNHTIYTLYITWDFARLKYAYFGQAISRYTSRAISRIGNLRFLRCSRTDKVNRSMSSGVKLEAIVRYPRSDLLSRTRAFYLSVAMKSQPRVEYLDFHYWRSTNILVVNK